MELKQITSPGGSRVYVDETTGAEYLSVTTPFRLIEAPPLEVWALRIGAEKAKRIALTAAAYGNALHSIWEKICKGEIKTEETIRVEVKPRYQADAQKLLYWFDTHVEEVLSCEKRVRIESIHIAGQLDTLCHLKGRPGIAVLDLKTGKIKAKAKMQMAAYREGAAETLNLPVKDITERVVLSCNRDRVKAQEYYFGVDQADYDAYCHLVEFYRWYHGPNGKVDLREAKKR